MSIVLTKGEVSTVLELPCRAEEAAVRFEGAEYDPQSVRGGELFVCLPGSEEDRAAAIEKALARGAALVMGDESVKLGGALEPSRLLVVPDVFSAFGKIAQWWQSELEVPVLAVGGSLGKSTIKEIAASLLLRSGKGLYSLEGLRNEVSVPHSLCRISRDHSWAVIEMRATVPGALSVSSKVAQPKVAVLGRVAPTGVQAFGSLDQLAAAQFEIAAGLLPQGWIVINRDDPLQTSALAALPQTIQSKVRSYGSSEDCDAWISAVRSFGLEGIEFSLHLLGEEFPITMRVLGRHVASAVAAAALSAKLLLPQLSSEQIASGLSGFTAPFAKLALQRLKGGRRVLNESSEANPVSMDSLLQTARDLMAENLKVGLLLGDMLDIGAQPEAAHDAVGRALVELKPAFLIGVGALAQRYVEAAAAGGVRAVDGGTPEAAAQLARKLDFDILLVKGSRGCGLDRAVSIIVDREGL